MSIFIHIPKVAGNSFQHALIESGYSVDHLFRKQGQDGINRFGVRSSFWRRNFIRGLKTLTKHQELNVYLNYYNSSELRSLKVLSFVRNPIDRLISLYFSPHRSGIHQNISAKRLELSDFDSFLQSVRTQRDFLYGVSNVDAKLVRVEDLNLKIGEVCNFLSIPVVQLQVRNQSHVAEDISAEFREKVVSLIMNSKHAEDFAFLAKNGIRYEI